MDTNKKDCKKHTIRLSAAVIDHICERKAIELEEAMAGLRKVTGETASEVRKMMEAQTEE